MSGHLRPLVLLALAKAERSGYQLMQHLHRELGHKPSPGSIYPLLKQLHREGMVRIAEGARTKTYTLTAKGKGEVRGVTADHHGMLDRVRDTLKLYQHVAGKNVTSDLTEMFGRLRQGKAPFGLLTPEMVKLRTLAIKATAKDIPAKRREEILRAMRKLNAMLRRVL